MSNLKCRIVATVLVVLVLSALCLGAVFSLSHSETICRRVSIDGTDVGGLTKQQAAAEVSAASARRLDRSVSIYAGVNRWTGKLRDLGVHPDVAASVAEAYRIGRDGDVFHRVWTCIAAPETQVRLKYLVDRKRFDSTLNKIAKTIESPHVDAKLRRTKEGFAVDPERVGLKIDREASTNLFEKAVETGNLSLSVKIVTDLPNTTASEFAYVDTLLASFTTRFPAWRKDRTHNIRMAAAKVDGTVVKPGEVFSYNDTVGPRLKSLGYKDAPIFVRGKLVPGTGGGICQLSSTIYNAALLADLEIVQRSNHSSIVPYVSVGRDATVAYGLRDLKFRNTTSAPIYIASRMSGSYLHVDIYGSAKDKADVAILVKKDGPLKVRVYRVVKKDGQVVSSELISRDRYHPAEHVAEAVKPVRRTHAPEPDIRAYPAQRSADSHPVRQADSLER